MNDYDRGRRDAGMFSEVRHDGAAWVGVLESTCIEATILELVTEQYVAGLIAGGCAVLVPIRSLEMRPGADRRNQADFATMRAAV